MANSPQARKRARQEEKRRQHNAGMRSMARTYIKKVYTAVKSGDQAKARDALRAAEPVIDKVANKGLIHRNKAARHKHRLSKQVKSLG